MLWLEPQAAHWLADAVLVAHLAFVLFVMFGGLLMRRWPRVVWVHLPAAAWAVVVEWVGWLCPLTPLEDALRVAAGDRARTGDFVARTLLPVLYPEGLTRREQMVLGLLVLLMNSLIYWWIFGRNRSARRANLDRA